MNLFSDRIWSFNLLSVTNQRQLVKRIKLMTFRTNQNACSSEFYLKQWIVFSPFAYWKSLTTLVINDIFLVQQLHRMNEFKRLSICHLNWMEILLQFILLIWNINRNILDHFVIINNCVHFKWVTSLVIYNKKLFIYLLILNTFI